MTMEATSQPEPTPAPLQPAAAPTELTAEDLRFRAALGIDFQTTAELTPGHDFVGQERARAALELGLGISSSGFNIFVSGLTGADKLEALRNWIARQAAQAPTPGDWVYVHNFARPDEPRAIALEAGKGGRLKRLMNEMVKTLKEELPKAFRQEAFDKEKSQLKDKYITQVQQLSNEIEAFAREKGFAIQAGPGGNILLIPLINGRPMESPEEFARLSPEEQQRIEANQRPVAEALAAFNTKQQDLLRAMAEDVRLVEKRFGEALLNPMLATINRDMHNPEVEEYLNEVKAHIIENLDDFKEPERQAPQLPFMPPLPPREMFLEYDVNVVVDNTHTRGAPVVLESSPTYLNLFGTIERVVDRAGRVVTNFTRIKSGSLLRAHGGYLIFNLEDALTEPAVWKTLKRTLKSGRIEFETYEPFALFSTSGLKPEPVHIQVKVAVVGSASLYYLLYTLDEEFREVFKVHADFRHSMELDAPHLLTYGQWAAQVCRQENLPHFDRSGVERLVEFGARQAGDRQKISASYAEITDLVREAAYWARKDNGHAVSARHVQKAIDERIFRSNRVEEEIRHLITEGTILVDIDGRKVGQVNGLSVLQLGDHSFGRPSRVTASVGMGQAGIINIERESRLSGSIHDKGLLILAGYLRNRYGQDKPLALSASLCFEQSYSGVEGDSASSTELYALLSRLANLPVRQDIAVTGSVNQWGEIQAIGGVNEKIEGFFDICRVHGLTGKQGVMIPVSNVRNLVLRADVIEAVAQSQFHIYPIRTIDQGIELLTGVRAGSGEEDNTVNSLVSKRLRELAMGLKAFAASSSSEAQSTTSADGKD
ncbi:MAG TPA: ATP-binding protein [Methylomirabilota bacterium]|jgi:ATP-dependent Lon protease|nr:ATP-binding protein [Methylomirabilota bacterium]